MMTIADARACLDRANEHFMKAGEHLAAARREVAKLEEEEGWRALGYASLSACVQAELGYSRQHVHRMVQAIEIENELSPLGDMRLTERLMRPLAKYAGARKMLFEFALVWADNNGVKLTAGIVEAVGDALGEMITTGTFIAGDESQQLDLYDRVDAHITNNINETVQRQKEHIRSHQRRSILSGTTVIQMRVERQTCQLVIQLPDNTTLEILERAIADSSLLVNLYEDAPIPQN